jgi:aspartyl-tRNA(Asn)/glutamyl-tRNA(Gln) amidotransferase subunit A
MAGHDPKDSTSAPVAVPDFAAAIEQGVKGLKVGIPREYRPDEGLSPEIDAIWTRGMEMLRDAGAETVDISLPHTKYALATYYIVAPAEASSNLARYDGVRYGLREVAEGDSLNDMYMKTRAAGFGTEVKRRILIGTYALSAGYYDAYYLKAQKVRALIARDFKAAFDGGVDVILTPTTPSAAFGLDEEITDPVTMYLNDVFTVPTSLAGLPGLSVPVALTDAGLPQGLQLIGRPFDEETVLRAGRALEKAAAFAAKPRLLEG